jgi:hypothetical protein
MEIVRKVVIDVLFLLVGAAAWVAALPAQENQENTSTQQDREEDPSQPLHYANYSEASTPKNILVIDFNGLTAYDDNVLGDNADRVGSAVFQGGAHIGLEEERNRSALSLDYLPEFLYYTNVNGYNQVNQSLRFGARYDLSRHFELRFEDTGTYYTGIASPRLNENESPASGPLPSLNNTVLIPLARELWDEGRVDAVYQMSRRSNFDFFGSAAVRNFSAIDNPLENLFNTQAFSGGLAYTYRLTATSTLGIMALHQNLRYGASLDRIESPLLTYAWQGKSGFTVSLYGGPQYVRLNDNLLLPNPPTSTTTFISVRQAADKWEGGGGANVGWRSPRTVVLGSAQRLSSDGGGIFTSVISTVESFEIRRHVVRHWDFLVGGENAQTTALSALFGGAVVNTQAGSLKIEREFAGNLVAQLGYVAGRQRVSGTYPFQVDMNRNYVSLGFFYRFKRLPLGR